MRSFFISFRSEFYKSRKTLAFWASILLPLLICGLITFGFLSNQERMIKAQMPAQALWGLYSGSSLSVMGMLILPFYVIFMAFSVNNIEHKNDTWKTLFSQPLNRLSIYAAKYSYAIFLIFICLFLFATLTYLFGNLIGLLQPALKFRDYNPLELLSTAYIKLFLSSLGILSVQFILSLIWGDFLKPMGVGFIGIIIGLIAASKGWTYAYLIPYSLPKMVLTISNPAEPAAFFSREIWSSLAYGVTLFVAGYFILAKKSIR